MIKINATLPEGTGALFVELVVETEFDRIIIRPTDNSREVFIKWAEKYSDKLKLQYLVSASDD